jgi:ElaB/YqjD/DUF883 family membrane-anchored ribosome-binding protein
MMDNEELAVDNDMHFNEDETCECRTEIESLRERIEMLMRDNAELISDNLELRAKNEALLEARAALPEFSAPTRTDTDKYGSVRDAFKNATKRK